jgi:exopolyphosphatase/guanosine-5'-triphosphate,3'-diphosphate pyrophosphatase
MAAIVPRWEWRTFGAHFGIAERKFAELTPGAVQESEELYFLGGSGEANAKVRDNVMDIKVLREMNADGLERWEPVMKQSFPIAAADVAKVSASVGVAVPAIGRQTYTLDQFTDEVIAPSGALQPVPVHKRRVRYTVGGCTSELTDVQANGRRTRAIAIEGEDANAVLAAVASVGLRGFFNMNYAMGLRALLDDAPERFAVIDVGTNSVKLHVAERTDDGSWRTLVDRAELTRLGEGLEKSGEIAPAAVERTANAMLEMSSEAKRSGVRAIIAVGTAGLRVARNSSVVVDEIRARTGVSIEVITGAEEGRLAYLAAKAGLRMPRSVVVFDTGGGSTQFTFGQGSQVDEQFSVNMGAVRYTEQFGLAEAVAPEVLRTALDAIAADLWPIDGRPPADALVAMGGAITNMAAVMHGLAEYDRDVVQGTVLSRAEIDRQIEMYRSRDTAERRSIIGLQPKRAEVILAGACIIRTVMSKLGQDALRVSDRGLRHGVLVERCGADA